MGNLGRYKNSISFKTQNVQTKANQTLMYLFLTLLYYFNKFVNLFLNFTLISHWSVSFDFEDKLQNGDVILIDSLQIFLLMFPNFKYQYLYF